MKKRLVALVVGMLVLAFTCGCAQSASSSASGAASSSASGADDRVSSMVSSMTTEQKLAQMVIVGLRTNDDSDQEHLVKELTQNYSDMLTQYGFGGVLLFDGNMADPAQTIKLIDACQNAALASEQGVPLLVACDVEGGMVNRGAFGATGPGNMALAATGDESLIGESATMLGEKMQKVGINMDFAPVSDVNNNPNNPIIGVRSFSDDPQAVANDVVLFGDAMKSTGTAISLKHFPGHGNVGTDSHTGLPSSSLTLEDLESCELIPFQAGIDAGADMIMTAHIMFPAIETQTYISKKDGKEITLPATLSHAILTDQLRTKMGFNGIIITDSMVMGAIKDHFEPVDAATLAINAGVDILLTPVNLYEGDGINTLTDATKFMDELAKRVESGEIDEAQLDESVTRILKLKEEKGILDYDATASEEEKIAEAEAYFAQPELYNRDWEMAQKAVTLLKNDGNMLPIDGNDGSHTLILYPTATRQATVEYAVNRLEGEGLLAKDAMTAVCYEELKADDKGIQKALEKADRVLILSQQTAQNEEMAKVLAQAHKDGKNVALISLGMPYDVASYTDADAMLCGYQPYGAAHDAEGNGPFNLNVAVVLCSAFGQSVPQGTLPVNIPKLEGSGADATFSTDDLLYERGFGLKNWGA